MEIEIPNQFQIKDCDNCGTRHAPVRGCPIVEEDDYDREADYWKYSGSGE